jgi:acyl-CoA synthetase (NDP forming)
MLMWWEQDGVTRLAVLYIESFGNPRKFARTARRVAASMPVLAVEAGRSAAGQRAAASHTAAAATPWVTREALFDQAGIIAVPGGTADGPIDTTAAISAGQFRECLELAAADEAVSAMIALALPTGATGDLVAAIQQADVRCRWQGSPAADLGALRDLLLRVSRLADDLPEVTDLDLNPVIARPDGVFVVDARVKVAPYAPQDPFLRKLR